MNLKDLSDQVLLENADRLAKRERELLIDILRHLREIERRRLFSSLGYQSLFDYAVRRLKYSEDQAGRRISAMRLMKELPELEEKIESGSLTLTNLGMAQSLFRQEAKTKSMPREEKMSLLSRLENISKREAERIVLSEASDTLALRPDHVHVVTETKVEIKFIAEHSLVDKIEKLKGLLAHSNPSMNMAELIDKLCDLALSRLDPDAPVPAPARVKPETRESDKSQVKVKMKIPPRVRLNIPAKVRREVFHNSGGSCQNCGSIHALQVDHIRPVARVVVMKWRI